MGNEGEGERYRKEAALALRGLKRRVRWKPGKALSHLEKRKAMGHLSPEASIEDYNSVIQDLVREEKNHVLLYCFSSKRYYAARGTVSSAEWIVIVTRAGVVETAFPPAMIDEYLTKRGFVLIGTTQEVLA